MEMGKRVQTNWKDSAVMYTPSESSGQSLKKLKSIIEDKYGVRLDGFWDFYDWSIGHLSEFWAEMWNFSGIIYSKKYDKVIDPNAPVWETDWFSGARLNYAENVLKYRDDKVALVCTGENGEIREMTSQQIYDVVKSYAAAFRKAGLTKGDVVVCYASNRGEPVLAMLAAVSIGAIWTGALPLLGAETTLKKFTQLKPKFLLTIDRFTSKGKEIEMLSKVKKISENLSSLQKVIIIPSQENSKLKNITELPHSIFLDDFLKIGILPDGSVPEIEFEQVSVSYPVFISFTSGTSGMPKAIIHGSGTLLAVNRDFRIQMDAPEGSTFFSISPVGWVSWNVLASLLSLGCKVVLYEGSAFHLDGDRTRVWELVQKFRVSHLMLPTSVLDDLERHACTPGDSEDVSSVKVLFAGGSVVKPQCFDFAKRCIPEGAAFTPFYGCTEVFGCCMALESTLPVRRGELNSVSLGNGVACLSEDGKHLVGEMGDLVITTPMPNFPVGLWGDQDGSEYKKKYFSKYPGLFLMGDYGVINPVTRGTIVYCRSDETLKQRGCRFGSSEIYSVVEKFAEVRDCLCVSQYGRQMDERAVLFLRMRQGCQLDSDLEQRVRDAIAAELTQRHVPDLILQTHDIPVNLNGKKMELLVKRVINRLPYNTDTLANPDSLHFYAHLPQLQQEF